MLHVPENCLICWNSSEDNGMDGNDGTDLAHLISVVERLDSESEAFPMNTCLLLLCTGVNQHLNDFLRLFSYPMVRVSLSFVRFITS